MPVMPGIRTSAIRHDAPLGSAELRKSSAEANTSAVKPCDRNMRCNASRTALSSSTIAISGSIGAPAAVASAEDIPVSRAESIGRADSRLATRNRAITPWCRRFRLRGSLGGGHRRWQGKPDPRATGYRGLGPQRSAMRLDDRAADRQPDANAIGLCRVKAVEDAGELPRRESGAGILDGDDDGIAA